MKPPLPANERDRLRALEEQRILDTLPEQCFDSIVQLAATACKTPIALFSLVDEDRQWFKSRFGLDIEETSRDLSFCAHAIYHDELLVIKDATTDPRFVENDLVVSGPGIRFYAGVPVRTSDSLPLGTLCVIDTQPRTLEPHQLSALEGLARELQTQLELRKALASEAAMREERAVLVRMFQHDASGMLAALGWTLSTLSKEQTYDAELIGEARTSVRELQELCERMREIEVGDAADLATDVKTVDLEPWFASITARARNAAKRFGIMLEARFEMTDAVVDTDLHLLDRIATNLYSNAIQSCELGNKITLALSDIAADRFSLIVADDGPGIEPQDAERIFEPFFSARGTPGSSGLGLAFCRMAVQSLGGQVHCTPNEPAGVVFETVLPRTAVVYEASLSA